MQIASDTGFTRWVVWGRGTEKFRSREEAALVFDDAFAISEPDRVQNSKQRWQTIGTLVGCLLLVVHTVHY